MEFYFLRVPALGDSNQRGLDKINSAFVAQQAQQAINPKRRCRATPDILTANHF